MVAGLLQNSRWEAETPERLAVGIFSKATGAVLRVVEFNEPRGAFCAEFNRQNEEWCGMIAEPVTLREPTEAEKAGQLEESSSSPDKPKRKRKSA